jgi:hypothetical protein
MAHFALSGRCVLGAVAALAMASSAQATIGIHSVTPGTTVYSGPTPTYDFNSLAGTPSTSGGAVVSGTTGNHAQPVGSTGGYFAVGPTDGNPGVIDLSSIGDINSISFIWGSVDTYNTLEFLDAANHVLASFSGSDIAALANGDQSNPATNPVVTFWLSGSDVSDFTSLRLTSTSNAFEIDNLAINSGVPEPATWAMMLLGFVGIGFGLRRQRTKSQLQVA